MAVAISVTGTKLIGPSSVTSINYTGITVAGGDTALIVTLTQGEASVSSAWTASWDSTGSPQSMTLLASRTEATNFNNAVIFGLRNPTSGLKTLALTWTGTNFPVVEAITVTGSDTSSDANAFPTANRTSNTGTATAMTLTVTSATNNMAVAAAAVASWTSPNQTIIYSDLTSGGADSFAQRAAGAATVSFTATGPGSGWVYVGIDVAVPAFTNTIMFADQARYGG